ncbi:MAG: hypothetical protein M1453_11100 [Acidobacteria bacterium]|nr:hypothetical protein [Acidobacteriota bacterium]MCL5288525.1 hypothetical protein [Acidobacteriota bacterium]
MDIFSNPELIRNTRAQMRWGRMISVAAICAVLSLVVGYAMAHSQSPGDPPGRWGMQFLQIVLGTQAVALLLGGSIACLNAVHREKEMNTFDFQRVTRLTPWELALGKLFGAPVVVYFAVLCLMPAALVGAVVGGARPTMVGAAYVVLLLGSITAHAFSLVISMLHQRGTNTGAILVLIILLLSGASASGPRMVFDVGALNPFISVQMVEQDTWQLSPYTPEQAGLPETHLGLADVFFGQRLHHVPVLLFLYVSFSGWFLLAVTRNLKRDPSVYELYTPNQSLGLLVYVNFLMLGFFKWGSTAEPMARQPMPMQPYDVQAIFLGINLSLFFLLGMVLLRNRDQIRRRLRELGDSASNWLAASWPAPYLLAGILLLGLATMGMISWKRSPKSEWDLALAAFRLGLVALWVVRDLLYLQWINLTRIRRPLTMGFVYLIVFYSSTAILFATLDLYDKPRGQAFTAFFSPAAVFGLTGKEWTGAEVFWWLAMFCQVAVAAAFAWMHRQKQLELAPAPAAAPAAESPLPTVG